MPNGSSDDGEITNLMLLQHMQGMRSGLERQMKGMRTSLEKRMDRMENRMDRMEHQMKEGFAEAKKDIKSINDALQRLYTHRVNMLGRIEKLEDVVGIAQ